MLKAIKFLLSLYRKMPRQPNCRFFPSCSQYAEEAMARYGPVNGGFLALKRLIRCNQWFPGGVDPVPVDLPAGRQVSQFLARGSQKTMFHVKH